MQDELLISVVIPLYNKVDTLVATVSSVLKQSYQNYEIIIVNDGSTDDSLLVLSSINDVRIRIYTITNSGVSSARNYAVKHSKGACVAFLDADDYWYPNHLNSLVKMIQAFPSSQWYATAYEIKHNKRLCLPMSSPLMNNGEAWVGEVADFFANSMQDCLAWTSAVCLRKVFFEELGGFDLILRNSEDTDLWIRAALSSPLIFTSKVSARYELSVGNHISQRDISDKTVMDFDKYEMQYPNNNSLKKYLDLNRYAVALEYKLLGQLQKAHEYSSFIRLNNLSQTQYLLLMCPSLILRGLMQIKVVFEHLSIRIRSN